MELEKLYAVSAPASQKSMAATVPVVERLHEYPVKGIDLGNLVTYPPKLQPIPVKPLFLDVAWNYIEYPGQSEIKRPTPQVPVSANRTDEAPEEKPTKRGWFGFGR